MMKYTALLLAVVALSSTYAAKSDTSHMSIITGMKLNSVPERLQGLVVQHIRARGYLDEQTLDSLVSDRSRRQASCPVQTANPMTCSADNIDSLFFTFSDTDDDDDDDDGNDDEIFTCDQFRAMLKGIEEYESKVPSEERAEFSALLGCLKKMIDWFCKYGDCFNQADVLFDLEAGLSSAQKNAELCNNACLKNIFEGVNALAELLQALENDPGCAALQDEDEDDGDSPPPPPPCNGPSTDSSTSQTESKVTYSVTESSGKTSTTFGCPEGHTLYVYDANYGNDATPCRNDTIALAVASKCNKHRFCTIDLNNMCDVCSDVGATLEITYVCVAEFSLETGLDKTLATLAGLYDQFVCAKDGSGAYCGALMETYIADSEDAGLTKSECEGIAGTCCARSFVSYYQEYADVLGISQTEIEVFEANTKSECGAHGVNVDNMFQGNANTVCGGPEDTTGGSAESTFSEAVESGSATAITATVGMVMAALLAQLF